MHDILKNLYYVSLFALILQFVGLFEPFAVIFGLTLLYLAAAELFMQADIDRLRRMNYISYRRRPDVSAAFVAMTLCFGLFYFASGVHFNMVFGPMRNWILGIGSLGALYIFLHQYLPFDGTGRRGSGRRRDHLRPL